MHFTICLHIFSDDLRKKIFPHWDSVGYSCWRHGIFHLLNNWILKITSIIARNVPAWRLLAVTLNVNLLSPQLWYVFYPQKPLYYRPSTVSKFWWYENKIAPILFHNRRIIVIINRQLMNHALCTVIMCSTYIRAWNTVCIIALVLIILQRNMIKLWILSYTGTISLKCIHSISFCSHGPLNWE